MESTKPGGRKEGENVSSSNLNVQALVGVKTQLSSQREVMVYSSANVSDHCLEIGIRVSTSTMFMGKWSHEILAAEQGKGISVIGFRCFWVAFLSCGLVGNSSFLRTCYTVLFCFVFFVCCLFFTNFCFCFSIKVSPPLFPAPLPSIPPPFFSLQIEAGLPQISDSHGISSCSEIRHLFY